MYHYIIEKSKKLKILVSYNLKKSKNNIISINLNQSNNFSFYYLEDKYLAFFSKYLVYIKYFISPFFYTIYFHSKILILGFE